jgi:hypothetical protein
VSNERVTLGTVPMRVAAGDRVTLWGGRTATVAMPGPLASSVWAIDDQTGDWLCAQWNGRAGRWHERGEKTGHEDGPDGVRRHIVREWVRRAGNAVQRPLTIEEARVYYDVRNDYWRPEHVALRRTIAERWEADRALYTWRTWHLLYPGVPFDPECVDTPAGRRDAAQRETARTEGQRLVSSPRNRLRA